MTGSSLDSRYMHESAEAAITVPTRRAHSHDPAQHVPRPNTTMEVGECRKG